MMHIMSVMTPTHTDALINDVRRVSDVYELLVKSHEAMSISGCPTSSALVLRITEFLPTFPNLHQVILRYANTEVLGCSLRLVSVSETFFCLSYGEY